MPAPPKLRDARGDVGIVEVLKIAEAEDAPKADGHVAVAGEIEIDVQHAGGGVEPVKEYGAVGARLERRDKLVKDVRQQDLFAQPQYEAPRAGGDVREGMGAMLQLRGNVRVAHDGAGDELREHGDIGGKVDEITLRLHVAAVDVHHIAEDLKGVEADADGQRHAEQRNMQPRERVKAGEEEVRVLAVAQKSQTEHERERQKELRAPAVRPVFLHQTGKHIALHDGREHENNKFRLAPGVEEQACEQQHGIFPTHRYKEIEHEHAGQEIEKEGNTGKQHTVGSSFEMDSARTKAVRALLYYCALRRQALQGRCLRRRRTHLRRSSRHRRWQRRNTPPEAYRGRCSPAPRHRRRRRHNCPAWR